MLQLRGWNERDVREGLRRIMDVRMNATPLEGSALMQTLRAH